jgi:hypothetical protein
VRGGLHALAADCLALNVWVVVHFPSLPSFLLLLQRSPPGSLAPRLVSQVRRAMVRAWCLSQTIVVCSRLTLPHNLVNCGPEDGKATASAPGSSPARGRAGSMEAGHGLVAKTPNNSVGRSPLKGRTLTAVKLRRAKRSAVHIAQLLVRTALLLYVNRPPAFIVFHRCISYLICMAFVRTFASHVLRSSNVVRS